MKKILFAFAFAAVLCASQIRAEEKGGKEEKIAVADLPKAIVDAVNTARAGSTIAAAEKQTKTDGTVVYEVDVTQGGKKYELKLDAAGKVLANEEDNEKDEKDEKDKKEEKK